MPALCSAKLNVSRWTPFGPKTITLPPYFFTSLAVATVRSIDGFALRRIGQIRTAVTRDEWKLVLLEKRAESAVRFHAVDLPSKQLDAEEAEARDVL